MPGTANESQALWPIDSEHVNSTQMIETIQFLNVQVIAQNPFVAGGSKFSFREGHGPRVGGARGQSQRRDR
jgi:hypothetical protein